jgi:hypothetical protein
MDERSDASGSAEGMFEGLPQTVHSSLTPLGQIEQAGKVAVGFRRSREGWRRVVFRAGICLVALIILSVVSFWIYNAATR